MSRHFGSTKMLLKCRVVLFGIALVVLIISIGYLSIPDGERYIPDGVFHRLKVPKDSKTDLQTDRNVQSFSNHGDSGKAGDVACVIEPALVSCGGIGFASVLLQTIDDVTTCLARGLTPTVIWTDCDYCGPSGANMNYWTWYFEAVNPGVEERADTRVCMTISWEYYNLTSVYLSRRTAEGKLVDFRFADMENKISPYFQPITPEIRTLVNYVISGYIKPASRVQKMVDAFYQSYMAGRINIGVHVRLYGDHLEEMAIVGQKAPTVADFLRVTRQVLDDIEAVEGHREVRIFLASDRDDVMAAFAEEFGNNTVVHTNAVRGEDMTGRLDDRVLPRQLGDQVLTDILLLSRCDYLVHDESNVASVAYYFNPKLQSHFVSGEVSDHARLNAQSRDDPEALLRQAVAKETNITWKVPDNQPSLSSAVSQLEKKEIMEVMTCFFRNVKRSKCGLEFATSNKNGLKAVMGI